MIAERVSVTITSLPSAAEIEVDGDFMGSTRSVIRLTTGTHHIIIKKPGYDPWIRTVKIGAGDALTVHADLHAAAKK